MAGDCSDAEACTPVVWKAAQPRVQTRGNIATVRTQPTACVECHTREAAAARRARGRNTLDVPGAASFAGRTQEKLGVKRPDTESPAPTRSARDRRRRQSCFMRPSLACHCSLLSRYALRDSCICVLSNHQRSAKGDAASGANPSRSKSGMISHSQKMCEWTRVQAGVGVFALQANDGYNNH